MAYRTMKNPDPEESDPFYFQTGWGEVERLTRYHRHGLHPVLLGQVLPESGTCVDEPDRAPRYRIFAKLGHGPSSTVWLARDILEDRWVAIKILQGSESAEKSREVTLLAELRDGCRGEPGHDSIIQLLDSFIIKGPNGVHQCIVTETVAFLSDIWVKGTAPLSSARQVAQAFSLLHQQGITHGDPCLDHVGAALPEMADATEEDVTCNLPDMELIPMMPCQVGFPTETVPAYVVQQDSLSFFLSNLKLRPERLALQIKVLGFGKAHKSSREAATPSYTPSQALQPPEVAIHCLSGADM